jgi:hypothetical protein
MQLLTSSDRTWVYIEVDGYDEFLYLNECSSIGENAWLTGAFLKAILILKFLELDPVNRCRIGLGSSYLYENFNETGKN